LLGKVSGYGLDFLSIYTIIAGDFTMNTASSLRQERSVKPIQKDDTSKIFRVIIAASIGNALEWFDLLTYGIFAIYIAKAFFPAANATASLMMAFGTFGASYLIRPLGAFILGAYADRAGRRASLMLSIILMMAGTLMIALMPSYASIGIWATIGIVLARLIQGFSVGGEFGSATALLSETAPERRGFMASFQFASQGLGTVLAATFGMVLSSTLSQEQLFSWGWRVPFIFGLLIGPVALYIRRYLHDAPEFIESAVSKTPVRDLLTHQKMRIAMAAGAIAVSTAVNYMILYMPTYAVKELGLSQSIGFGATLVTGLILTCATPFFGHWSDKVGRTRIMVGAALLILVSVYPLYTYLSAHATFVTIMLAMIWIGVLKSMYFGALPALMAELFPMQTRATGMSLGYNIGVTVFGGFAPVIVTWLIGITGNKSAPGLYLSAVAVLSLVTLYGVRRMGIR
jgi:MHS family proline/betaine transporter-like MFS transporter